MGIGRGGARGPGLVSPKPGLALAKVHLLKALQGRSIQMLLQRRPLCSCNAKGSKVGFPAAHAQFSEGSPVGACTFLFALAKPKVIQFALITTISPELSPDSDRRSL